MMLHDNIAPGQYLFDAENDCRNAYLNGEISPPTGNSCTTYSYSQRPIPLHIQRRQYRRQQLLYYQQEQHREPEQIDSMSTALDLSRRSSSVETRKTPSPYNSTSSHSAGSPNVNCVSPSVTIPLNTPQTSPQPLATNEALLPNTLLFPPQIQHAFPSVYPITYPPHVKKELISPPPLPAALPNSLSLYPPNPAAHLPQSNNSTMDEQNRFKSTPTGLLYPNILNAATTGSTNIGRAQRPFNAYPRDPDLVTAHFKAADRIITPGSMDYNTFRKRLLEDIHGANGANRIISNPKMRRTNTRNSRHSESDDITVESSDNDSQYNEHINKNEMNNNSEAISTSPTTSTTTTTTSSGGTVKDQAYYERRRKNNAAAKKSRDRRRIKEDEIAIRAAFLERQNIELLCQIDALKKQLQILTKC